MTQKREIKTIEVQNNKENGETTKTKMNNNTE